MWQSPVWKSKSDTGQVPISPWKMSRSPWSLQAIHGVRRCCNGCPESTECTLRLRENYWSYNIRGYIGHHIQRLLYWKMNLIQWSLNSYECFELLYLNVYVKLKYIFTLIGVMNVYKIICNLYLYVPIKKLNFSIINVVILFK